jgi:hypothetical protein
MTLEVGKLYRERHRIESQITELFAFHSRHHSAAMVTVFLLLLDHYLLISGIGSASGTGKPNWASE